MKLQVGDRVQLRVVPPFNKAGRMLQPREKGVVTAISDEGYTVEFDDSMTPVVRITDEEIEPVTE